MDPYLQHHQYQQQIEHQHAHFYRQPAPSSSTSALYSFNPPIPSLSTTAEWGTAVVDPLDRSGPSSAWDAEREILPAAVGNRPNSWEHFTVGHALAGLTSSCE